MAPVGPLTWTLLPPNTAATAPATIAVTSPAPAPMPELTPKPRASGSAISPTIRPALRSRPMRACAQSDLRGSRPAVRESDACSQPLTGGAFVDRSAAGSSSTRTRPDRMRRAASSRSRTSGALTE